MPDSSTPEQAAQLAALVPQFRARWPRAQLDDAALEDVLRQRSGVLLGELEERRREVLLCLAAVHRDPDALAELERGYVRRLEPAVLRVVRDRARLEDVLQTLRLRLLVGSERQRPRLEDFRGDGPLVGWLRVAAVRFALEQVNTRHVSPTDLETAGWLAGSSDTEQALLRGRYRPHFKEALRAAFGDLERRERLILRLRFRDGLSLERIAPLYGVNPSTIWRWIERAKADVRRSAQKHLQARLGLTPEELDSLLDFAVEQLSISLSMLDSEAPNLA